MPAQGESTVSVANLALSFWASLPFCTLKPPAGGAGAGAGVAGGGKVAAEVCDLGGALEAGVGGLRLTRP